MAALKTIRAVTQALDGRQATWDSVSLPVPERVWIIASDTSAVKIGNGISRYADLPVAFYLNNIDVLAAQVPDKADKTDVAIIADHVSTHTIQLAERLIVDTIDPQPNIGTDGAHYLNSATLTLFGPRTDGAWGVGMQLITSNQLTQQNLGSYADFEAGLAESLPPQLIYG